MFKKSNDKKSQTTRDCLLFLSLQQPVKNPSLGLQQTQGHYDIDSNPNKTKSPIQN